MLAKILASGCSRVPVWEPGSPESVCGILVVKRLLLEREKRGSELGSLQMDRTLRRKLHPPVIASKTNTSPNPSPNLKPPCPCPLPLPLPQPQPLPLPPPQRQPQPNPNPNANAKPKPKPKPDPDRDPEPGGAAL